MISEDIPMPDIYIVIREIDGDSWHLGTFTEYSKAVQTVGWDALTRGVPTEDYRRVVDEEYKIIESVLNKRNQRSLSV